LPQDELNSLLTDMEEQGVVKSWSKPLNAAVKLWKRTEAGRAHLESLGMI
jgi:hypothetical protein